MSGLSSSIYAEGYAEGVAKGRAESRADNVSLYMRKTGATLGEALDFLEIDGPSRLALFAWIEEHDDAFAVLRRSRLGGARDFGVSDAG